MSRKIQFLDQTINVGGEVPAAGSPAPNFLLAGDGLSEVALKDFEGKKLVLNIFPSIDTPTCAQSVRAFNEKAANMENTVVLCVSADLPFAASRFCDAQGIDNVSCASTFRSEGFADAYGVKMLDSALAGLCARAVVVIDEHGKVLHSQLVDPISDEPDYEAVLAAL